MTGARGPEVAPGGEVTQSQNPHWTPRPVSPGFGHQIVLLLRGSLGKGLWWGGGPVGGPGTSPASLSLLPRLPPQGSGHNVSQEALAIKRMLEIGAVKNLTYF